MLTDSKPDSGPASSIILVKRLCSSGSFDGLKRAQKALIVAVVSLDGLFTFLLFSDGNDGIDGLGGNNSWSDDIHGHKRCG